MKWKFWTVILGLFLLVVFVAQNYRTVEIKFLFWSFTTSRAIIMFITMVIGIIIGWTAALLKHKIED